KRSVVGFGSKRDYDKEGYYIRNDMFPKLSEEMKFDRDKQVLTKRYLLLREYLFFPRKERLEDEKSSAYLLDDEDAIIIGPNTKQPFVLKGQIGMSGMS